MRPSRVARAVVAAALLVLAASSAGCSRHAVAKQEDGQAPPGEVWLTDAQVAEAKVKVEPLVEQDVDDVIVTSGKVTFDDSRVQHVFSPVSGKITHIDAKIGQRVKKGDVLATLESPDIGVAVADLRKAEADVIAAQHDLDRQTDMLNKGATSERDYQQAEDQFRKAKAEMERAKQKAMLFRASGSDVVTQTYAIRSDLDGEVITRNITPGVEVSGQYGGGTAVELFTVGELDKVWIIADVYEMDIGRVKTGSKVNIKLIAFPNRTFPATIDWVAGALDPLTRTAKVRCVLDNPDRALKPEMYATLYISVEERKALAIPRGALLRMGEQTAVFVDKGLTPDGRHIYAREPISVDETEGDKWLPIQHDSMAKGTKIVTEGGILMTGEGAK